MEELAMAHQMTSTSSNTAHSLVRRCLPWFLAAFSGLFLWSAYPPWNESESAWFALVPLLGVLRFASPRRGFQLGLLCGLMFWFPSLSWLWRLTDNGGPWPLVVLGHLALSFYCALYTGVFGALVASLWQERAPAPDGEARGGCVWLDLLRAVLSALLWAGLELLRSVVLTGFAWNHLAVSQASSRAILQLASVGGVCLVSALVLLLNATLANVAVRVGQGMRGTKVPRRHWDLMVTLALVAGSFLWGVREIRYWERLEARAPVLTVAAVQPDAPSIFEREDDSMLEMTQRLADRTSRVAAFRPDVIVWPETVLFGVVPGDRDAMDFAFEIARRSDAPLLAGATEVEPNGTDRPLVANVSWLFQPDGSVSHRYRKQHLVPFGEYIPLDRWIPWLERLSPIGFSCTPGRVSVLMPVPMRGGLAGRRGQSEGQADAVYPEAVLSPLICFEDTVAALARKAVRKGATVLVNQSNDAWFAGSSEGEQHHAQAVFRAIENRTPLVRCSNTGVSGVIDSTGRSSEAADYFVAPVAPRQPDWPLSPYTRWGDFLFGWPCVAVVLLVAVRLRLIAKKPPESEMAEGKGDLG